MISFTKISPAEQIERWENVLRVLRGLTKHQRKKHWDMFNYLVQTDCGTIGCAVGHCSLDPWFQAQGLKIKPATRAGYPHEARLAEPILDEVSGFHTTEIATCISRFFGAGCNIFFDQTARPVGAVIREVRKHITSLKKEHSRVNK